MSYVMITAAIPRMNAPPIAPPIIGARSRLLDYDVMTVFDDVF
jgi:hypothetical protein